MNKRNEKKDKILLLDVGRVVIALVNDHAERVQPASE